MEEFSLHCLRSVRFRSYSGPYFLAFGLNTERYGVSLRIHSECGKLRTRTTSNTDTFHALLSEYKIENVKIFTQSLTKIFCIRVFNVGGCLASCLTFKPFLTLDLQRLPYKKKKRVYSKLLNYFKYINFLTTEVNMKHIMYYV